MKFLIEAQPAYLLHSRPFRDSSLLLDFITPDHGRIKAISRGARRASSRHRGILQPFIPLRVSLSGKSELKTLRSAEARQEGVRLPGDKLFSAMYVNEITVRLFHSHEADPVFFNLYESTLNGLSGERTVEEALRNFELKFLDILGYGVDFSVEAGADEPVEGDAWYCLQEEGGFVRAPDSAVEIQASRMGKDRFQGDVLLKISRRDFSAEDTRKTAKRILRQIFSRHLGGQPLASRSLFNPCQSLEQP